MKRLNITRDVSLQNTWKEKLFPEFEKDYMKNLSAFLREEKAKKKIIYPFLNDFPSLINSGINASKL